MKILIADKFEKSGIEALKAMGCEVSSEPDIGSEGIPGTLARLQPRVLIVRSTKVPAKALENAASVKLIIRAGAGVDNIDVKAASAKGIAVCNCPGMNAIAVAEVAMGLLLCCDRRIPEQTAALKAGQWNKKEYGSKARGLKGSTLGVVGCGAIGRAMIKRALVFEMKVLAWSRSITREHARDLGANWAGTDTPALLELAANCDAVSIHLPAAPDTNKLIGKAFFDRMKPGAYFVNTSRGSIVDEAALRDAIQGKGIRAGLDVYENQPAESAAPWSCPTSALPGFVGTHHCGASTQQAQDAVAEETVRIVRVFKESGTFENQVNG